MKAEFFETKWAEYIDIMLKVCYTRDSSNEQAHSKAEQRQSRNRLWKKWLKSHNVY